MAPTRPAAANCRGARCEVQIQQLSRASRRVDRGIALTKKQSCEEGYFSLGGGARRAKPHTQPLPVGRRAHVLQRSSRQLPGCAQLPRHAVRGAWRRRQRRQRGSRQWHDCGGGPVAQRT